MSERIDHVAKSIELGELASENWNKGLSATATAQMAGAQAHAMLALVEQQRIANRIAISAIVADDQRFYGQYGVSGNLTGPQGVFTLDNDGNPVLDQDIREGLGR